MSSFPRNMDRYAISRMMETHEIFLEEETGTADSFGVGDKVWVPYQQIKGLFWWWPARGEGGFQEEGDPERSVDKTGGGVLIPRGVKVIEAKHRVGKILLEGQVEVNGPFRIVSVRDTPTHIELSLIRP